MEAVSARLAAAKAHREAHPDPWQDAHERREAATRLYAQPIAAQIRERPGNVTALGVVLHEGNVVTLAGAWRLRDCRVSVTRGGGTSGAAAC